MKSTFCDCTATELSLTAEQNRNQNNGRGEKKDRNGYTQASGPMEKILTSNILLIVALLLFVGYGGVVNSANPDRSDIPGNISGRDSDTDNHNIEHYNYVIGTQTFSPSYS